MVIIISLNTALIWAHIDTILQPYNSLDIITTTTKILTWVFHGLEDADTIETIHKIFLEKLKRYNRWSKVIFCDNQLWNFSYTSGEKTMNLSYYISWTSIKSQIGELLSIHFTPETQAEINAIDTMLVNNKKIIRK